MSRLQNLSKETRLYVPDDLGSGRWIVFSTGQSHYLRHVMRLQDGDFVRLFNGRDGEWQAKVTPGKKQLLEAEIVKKIKDQAVEPALFLFSALIKRAHFDFLVMKATELGVTKLIPCLTMRTQVRDMNQEHARAIAIEAAEQSERLTIPELSEPIQLKKLKENWPKGCLPIVCAEWGEALPIAEALKQVRGKDFSAAAIITGPEGGFSSDEMELLRSLPHALPVRLGPRILRADTAALAALTCWQALCGDWH
jgi:16S rRNA (uracil1498-N3)-methyltransferase